jgi:hypothetical protein
MPKKKPTASEPMVTGGAAPARTRKHAPAKRTATNAVATSPSIAPATDTATDADITLSNSIVTFDEIAKLAYSYWEARGYQGGSPEEDWLRAEEELNVRLVSAAQA